MRDAVAPWCPDVRFFEETDSTNRVALDWARDGGPNLGIVVAGHQTAGRGRLRREWFAPANQSLLFSLLLRPSFEREMTPLINLAAALGLCEALVGLGFEPKIKWPNDLLLSDRKVAGILSELGQPEHLDANGALVVGIGVNVNVESFPVEIKSTATSLLAESGAPVERLAVLRSFLERFVPIYKSFPKGVVEGNRRYSSTVGSKVRVSLSNRDIEGVALDLDSQGRLVLSGGEIIEAGDVIHLR